MFFFFFSKQRDGSVMIKIGTRSPNIVVFKYPLPAEYEECPEHFKSPEAIFQHFSIKPKRETCIHIIDIFGLDSATFNRRYSKGWSSEGRKHMHHDPRKLGRGGVLL